MRCTLCCGSESEIHGHGDGDAKTVVLVGKVGNGKSATGNSIIGRPVFDSKRSLASVTSTCQLQTTVLDDAQILNVIDTPGLFDSSVKHRVMAEEIAQCINMAKDGIHALLLVLSLATRFSEEEALAFESLCQIFGAKIADYMIVVFAHGDVLEENQCLDDLLGPRCPDLLKTTLRMCGNRRVLFDNKTTDQVKQSRQRKELLSLVEAVVESNGGKPYDLFDELKNGQINLIDQTSELPCSEKSHKGQLHITYEEQFEQLIKMVELRLGECILRLEKQLAEERAARLEAVLKAQAAQTQSKDEMIKMEERLKKAEDLSKELQEKLKRAQSHGKHETADQTWWRCVIM